MNALLKSRRGVAVSGALGLALTGWIDYATGHELIFSAAYLAPVSLVAWHFGRGAIIAMSIAGGASTWITDLPGGKPYSHFLYYYGNSVTCLLVGLLLRRLKGVLDRQKQANDELKKALDELSRTSAEIRRLQDGLQVVCAWTKRIKVDDGRMTPEQFVSGRLGLKLSHGISPEALRELRNEAAQMREATGFVLRTSNDRRRGGGPCQEDGWIDVF